LKIQATAKNFEAAANHRPTAQGATVQLFFTDEHGKSTHTESNPKQNKSN
jgi:hypothetical protein